MTVPNNRTDTEAWLEGLGTKFVDVWFFVKGVWIDERHVDDDETFLTTVDMSASRLRANYALWDHGNGWSLLKFRSGDTKCYPTREAAEMVAIHNA